MPDRYGDIIASVGRTGAVFMSADTDGVANDATDIRDERMSNDLARAPIIEAGEWAAQQYARSPRQVRN